MQNEYAQRNADRPSRAYDAEMRVGDWLHRACPGLEVIHWGKDEHDKDVPEHVRWSPQWLADLDRPDYLIGTPGFDPDVSSLADVAMLLEVKSSPLSTYDGWLVTDRQWALADEWDGRCRRHWNDKYGESLVVDEELDVYISADDVAAKYYFLLVSQDPSDALVAMVSPHEARLVRTPVFKKNWKTGELQRFWTIPAASIQGARWFDMNVPSLVQSRLVRPGAMERWANDHYGGPITPVDVDSLIELPDSPGRDASTWKVSRREPPSYKQLATMRDMAEERGVPVPLPRNKADAARAIKHLKALPRVGSAA